MDIVPSNPKPVRVCTASPAFSPGEMPQAHQALDIAGIPRMSGGVALTLPERIAWMHGQLVSARLAQTVIFVYRERRR